MDDATGNLHGNDTVCHNSARNIVKDDNNAYICIEGNNAMEEDSTKGFGAMGHNVTDTERNNVVNATSIGHHCSRRS